MKKNILFVVFTIFLGVVFSRCIVADKPSEKEIKNFVLIYTDELDFSDIGIYGSKFKTPNIDMLASEGIVFSNAYTTSSMCTPSRYSVITGHYPGRCKGDGFLEENPKSAPYIIAWNTSVQKETVTLPKVLNNEGFITGISGKWHIGDESKNREFPIFTDEDNYASNETKVKLKKFLESSSETIKMEGGFDVAKSVLWGNFDMMPIKELYFHNYGWFTKGGVEFIQENGGKEKPFFLYFAPTAIHGPNHFETMNADQRKTLAGYDKSITKYIPSEDSLNSLVEGYSDSQKHRYIGIANIDYQVGRLIRELKEKDIYDETLIIFMADHGIEPGKAVAFEKGMKVPMIVRIPGGKFNGEQNNALVQNIDVFPTLLDYAGIEIPENVNLDGKSLKGLLEGNVKKVHDYIYTESGLSRSITDGKYKYIAWRYPKETVEKMENGTIDYAPNQLNRKTQDHSDIAIKFYPGYFDFDQLYNLELDPFEQNNISEANPEILKEYQVELKKITDTFNHPFDYSIDPFLYADEYKKRVAKAKLRDINTIEWYIRDHGSIVYPPKRK